MIYGIISISEINESCSCYFTLLKIILDVLSKIKDL